MIEMPVNLKWVPRETARLIMAWAFSLCGVAPTYPMTTPHVKGLVKLCGFKLDHNRLNYIFRMKRVKGLAKQSNELQWQEENILDLMEALEAMRSWIPMHPLHEHKLTPKERLQHIAAAQEDFAIVKYLRSLYTDELVNLLQRADDFETRSMISTVLREKLNVTQYEAHDTTCLLEPTTSVEAN
ncbi:MAG: hypothetical protein ACYC3X_29785 [Pirellulaceae bacterium]